jgi:hypothetical protein
VHWIYVSCTQTPGDARAAGACAFLVPATLAPGIYEVRLLSNDGFTHLATSNLFTVTGEVTLSVAPLSVAAGGTVTATWSGIPQPTPTDWLGLYAPDVANTAYLDWIYVSCTQTPGDARAAGACAFLVPATLAAGPYHLRLLANDGFTALAISDVFTVTAPAGASVFRPVAPGAP